MGACFSIAFGTGYIVLATNAFLGKLVRVKHARVPKNHMTRPTSCRLTRSVTRRNVAVKQVGAKAPMHVSKQDIRCRSVRIRSKRRSCRGFSFVKHSHGLRRLPY